MRCGSPAALGLAAQWSFWAVLELEELLLDLLMHRALLPEFSRERSHAERDELLLQKPLSVLNAALAERRFRAGERKRSQRASILSWGKIAKLNTSAHSEAARWLDTWLTRPAYGSVRDMGRR